MLGWPAGTLSVVTRLFYNVRAFTLIEMAVSILLVSLVFITSIGVYSTGSRFLQNASSQDVTIMPVVSLEDIAKRISLANQARLNVPNRSIHLRGDYAVCSYTALNTPGNFADDTYWHFGFQGGALRAVCDNDPNRVINAADPAIINNTATPPSAFTAADTDVSGINALTVNIRVLTNVAPITELDTNVTVGGATKR